MADWLAGWFGGLVGSFSRLIVFYFACPFDRVNLFACFLFLFIGGLRFVCYLVSLGVVFLFHVYLSNILFTLTLDF